MWHANSTPVAETEVCQKPGVVFQLWSDDAGVFFSKETYARYRLIEIAIGKAKTWQEFEELLPDSEFERLDLWWANGGEHAYHDSEQLRFIAAEDITEFRRLCGESRIIRPLDKFDASRIGVDEGDYPPWLSNTADDILPKEFVERFGNRVGGMTSGTWTEYPLEDLMEMVEVLSLEGHSVMAHLSYEFGWWRQIDLAS